MMAGIQYHSVDVRFEYTTSDSANRRVNRAVITVYGSSELAVLAEMKRQYPQYGDIAILEMTVR